MILPLLGLALWLPASTPPADPARQESEELAAILAKSDPGIQAEALAVFLSGAADPSLRRTAYGALVRAYIQAVRSGIAVGAAVEDRLLAPGLEGDELGRKLAACNAVADSGAGLSLAERCLVSLPSPDAGTDADRARLRGILAAHKGEWEQAQEQLAIAALTIPIERDPKLYLRLTTAQAHLGQSKAACATAKRLVRAHPLVPGGREALAACGDARAAERALENDARKALLASRRKSGKPAPALSLENARLEPVDIEPAKLGKVTVLVFFSSWCPHCAVELTRLATFAKALAADEKLSAKVRLVGIRTAVEREREPYEAFAVRHGIDFEVLTDSTMSLMFVRFAKAAGVQPALPLTAVLDAGGVVRYLLGPGEYKDTAAELTWAVQSLLRR